MPAPPPESEPAIVSIAGVPPPLCIGNGFIVVSVNRTAIASQMMGPKSPFLGHTSVAFGNLDRYDITDIRVAVRASQGKRVNMTQRMRRNT
jgi:hypothetical protein